MAEDERTECELEKKRGGSQIFQLFLPVKGVEKDLNSSILLNMQCLFFPFLPPPPPHCSSRFILAAI